MCAQAHTYIHISQSTASVPRKIQQVQVHVCMHMQTHTLAMASPLYPITIKECTHTHVHTHVQRIASMPHKNQQVHWLAHSHTHSWQHVASL